MQKENRCPSTKITGVSLLHRNTLPDVKVNGTKLLLLGYNVHTLQGNEKKVAAIFEAFENFHLGKESFHHLYKQIVAGLDKVMINTKSHASYCANCSYISRLTRQTILANVIEWLI